MYHLLGIKYILFFIVLLTLATGYLILNTASAKALTMSNENYILEMGTFNAAGGKASGEAGKMGITVGQTAPGLYGGSQYKVKVGFQYLKSTALFTFSVSPILIDFGLITPTNPVKRTGTLTVSSKSSHGYAVYAYENHPLLDPLTGSLIPNTTCDNGLCTESVADVWQDSSVLTYGFGYRCDNLSGKDCALGFSTNKYKQFADIRAIKEPQIVMKGKTSANKTQAQITYKVNVSTAQPAGLYTNTLTYIAIPTY